MTDRELMQMALEELEELADVGYGSKTVLQALRDRLAQPEPEPTVEDNSQNWAGMDGAVAWHLIDRHADNWADVGKMMDEWLSANAAAAIRAREQA